MSKILQNCNALPALAFVLTIGYGVTAEAQTCPYTVEVNAVRAGSPTIQAGAKTVTAKARIVKGTAPANTTQPSTDLMIEAFRVSDSMFLGDAFAFGITLEVGKGGQGAKLSVPVACVPGDEVFFTATFVGTATANGATCVGVGVSRIKTCQ